MDENPHTMATLTNLATTGPFLLRRDIGVLEILPGMSLGLLN